MSHSPYLVARHVDYPMTRRDRFVTVGDHEIHYSEWGDQSDPPVVCVHGLSRVGRDFDPVARDLAADYHVICPDMPGRGLSEWADDPETAYLGSSLMETCIGFCDALELDELRWLGTSMGGGFGMALAGGPMADRITHVVVNDVGPGPAEDEDADEGIDRIIEYLTSPPTFETFTGMEAYFREVYATFSAMDDAEWRRLTHTSSRRTDDGAFIPNYDPRVVEPLLTEESDADPWALFEAIEAPILTLKGTDSDILTDATFAQMQEYQPDMETLVIDCGHCPALNTERQIGAIRELFAR